MPSFRTYRSGPLCEAEYSGTIVNNLALVNQRHCTTAGHLFCMQLFQDLRPLLLHALCTILTATTLRGHCSRLRQLVRSARRRVPLDDVNEAHRGKYSCIFIPPCVLCPTFLQVRATEAAYTIIVTVTASGSLKQ